VAINEDELVELLGQIDERLASIEEGRSPAFDAIASGLASLGERVAAVEFGGVASDADGGVDEDLDPATLPVWAEWLVETYDLRSRLPRDWTERPHLVRELAALRAAWVVGYESDGVVPERSSTALHWHESLQRAVVRWHDELTTTLHPHDDGLGDWIAWLVTAYRIEDRFPKRWDSIPGVRQEVAALRAAHRAAYTEDGRPRDSSAALTWHEYLDRSFDRIKKWADRDETRGDDARLR
jgi:hypothetical protein